MGQTVTSNTVLSRYTYAGDINLDGKINIDDYNYSTRRLRCPRPPGRLDRRRLQP